jgi:hypothetical protein
MTPKNKEGSINGFVVVFLVFISAIALRNGFINNPAWYWIPALTFPILIMLIIKARKAGQPYHRKFRRNRRMKTRRQASEISF